MNPGGIPNVKAMKIHTRHLLLIILLVGLLSPSYSHAPKRINIQRFISSYWDILPKDSRWSSVPEVRFGQVVVPPQQIAEKKIKAIKTTTIYINKNTGTTTKAPDQDENWEFDQLGRLIKKSTPQTAVPQTFHYDVKGNLVKIKTEAEGQDYPDQDYTYNKAGQLITSTYGEQYKYFHKKRFDNSGRLIFREVNMESQGQKSRYPQTKETFEYTASGKLFKRIQEAGTFVGPGTEGIRDSLIYNELKNGDLEVLHYQRFRAIDKKNPYLVDKVIFNPSGNVKEYWLYRGGYNRKFNISQGQRVHMEYDGDERLSKLHTEYIDEKNLPTPPRQINTVVNYSYDSEGNLTEIYNQSLSFKIQFQYEKFE